jgi:hypothetical protein
MPEFRPLRWNGQHSVYQGRRERTTQETQAVVEEAVEGMYWIRRARMKARVAYSDMQMISPRYIYTGQ